jgi:hypothetical protein
MSSSSGKFFFQNFDQQNKKGGDKMKERKYHGKDKALDLREQMEK